MLLDNANEPYHARCNADREQAAQNSHAQHNETRGVIAQIKLMHTKHAQENRKQACGNMVFRMHERLLVGT